MCIFPVKANVLRVERQSYVDERKRRMNSLRRGGLVQATAMVCVALLIPGEWYAHAQDVTSSQASSDQPQEALLSPAALESLVAPIALYPDDLMAQVLAAATYPLEIVEANRWVKKNPGLKGQALVQGAAQQNWEPCVQALVMFGSVLNQLDTNLKWTTQLGNAFLAQQEDLMLAVQRLREKAHAAGTLVSNSQQQVDVEQVQGASVIVIRAAAPDVIYVPEYNPTVVFGAADDYLPYPEMDYPPVPVGGIVAASAISFTAGIVVGAILNNWGGGGWGWGCNWGPRPSLYVNNTFINRNGFRAPAYVGRSGTGAWVHNPSYRGAVPYSSASVANRYGAGRAVATPGTAAGVRTPNGAAGITTPGGSAGALTGASGTAARDRAPDRSAGTVTSPRGSADRTSSPASPAGKTPRGTFTNPTPNPFGGGGAQTRMNSSRGAASMGGARMGGMGMGGGGRRR
jgi:Protein of unknown function (DUF3300)